MDILKLLIEYGIIGILLSLGFIVIYIAFERNFAFNRIELSQFKNKNSLEEIKKSIARADKLNLRIFNNNFD